MSGRFRAVAIVLLVVLSSVGLAAGTAGAADESGIGVSAQEQSEPDEDVLGRECGYWHDQSIDVNQSDGFDDEELDAVVCRTMARVEQIRGLEFNETVPVTIQSRDEFREQAQNSSAARDLRAFDNAKFEALFLINQSTDSIEVQDENRGASVLGYYSPTSGEIVLVAPNESDVRIDEFTLAHELVHALQDQHFDLTRNRGETRDEVNARDGLVEGEARYIEHRYRETRCQNREHDWNGTCLRFHGGGAGSDELANYGVYFLKYQPYSDGPSYVSDLRSRGGWAAVDAAYDEPPESAEQVIHPEKYPDETPSNVTLSDRTSDGWERVRPPARPDYAEVGQTGIASMIVYPMYHSGGTTQIVPPRSWLNYTERGEISTFDPLNYGFESAAGWAGDRMHVYRNAENETAYVWRVEWDTHEDSEEFIVDYHRVLEYWDADRVRPGTYRFNDTEFGDAIRIVRENETVTIVSAPTVEELQSVRNGSLPPANATVEGNWPSTDGANATNRTELRSPAQPGFGPAMTVAAVLLGIAVVVRRG